MGYVADLIVCATPECGIVIGDRTTGKQSKRTKYCSRCRLKIIELRRGARVDAQEQLARMGWTPTPRNLQPAKKKAPVPRSPNRRAVK